MKHAFCQLGLALAKRARSVVSWLLRCQEDHKGSKPAIELTPRRMLCKHSLQLACKKRSHWRLTRAPFTKGQGCGSLPFRLAGQLSIQALAGKTNYASARLVRPWPFCKQRRIRQAPYKKGPDAIFRQEWGPKPQRYHTHEMP